jgi:hypothetical protein
MSIGSGRQNIIILFWKEQFHFWEYINGNQTFILDSHRPFICSAGFSSAHLLRAMCPHTFLNGLGLIASLLKRPSYCFIFLFYYVYMIF